ncbi:MAG: hypothetical protein IT462_09530 [Planctomycetes bacterium]|nr:hypothetical protein [Planctomycetota bacterium]
MAKAKRNRPGVIKLNRKLPFVGAIFDYIETGKGLAKAAKILRAEEERHGVFLVRLPDSDYVKRSPYRTLSRRHEAKFLGKCLFPFLSATELILDGGAWRNEHDILDSKNRALSASWRGWGDILAQWANSFWHPFPYGRRKTYPLDNNEPKSTSGWTYIDFYMDGYAGPWSIKNYDHWAKSVVECIKYKTEKLAA